MMSQARQQARLKRASHFRDVLIAGFIGLAIAALLATIGITIAAAIAHSNCNHLNH